MGNAEVPGPGGDVLERNVGVPDEIQSGGKARFPDDVADASAKCGFETVFKLAHGKIEMFR